MTKSTHFFLTKRSLCFFGRLPLPVSHESRELLGHKDNGEVNNFGVSDEKGGVGVITDSLHHVVKKCVLRGNQPTPSPGPRHISTHFMSETEHKLTKIK